MLIIVDLGGADSKPVEVAENASQFHTHSGVAC